MISCPSIQNRGRIGNQFFLYSIGKILSIIHNTQFYVNPSKEFLNLFDQNRLTYKKTKPKDTNFYKYQEENAFNFDINVFHHKNIELHGFFQNIDYYQEFQQELQLEFIPNPKIIKNAQSYINIKTNNSPNNCCIHIRRKDYINLRHIYNFLDLSYYKNILTKIDCDYIFVITDDMNLVKSEFAHHPDLISKYKIIFTEELDYAHQFYIMYLSRLKVLSNSTYSWWAAFLSDRTYDSKVYVPFPWTINNRNINLYPKQWIKSPIKTSRYNWNLLFETK